MDSLIVENVRCFKDKQEIPLRPITILVGENSTGKSTFLALIHYAHRLLNAVGTPDFNQDPFTLGAYDQIAHYHGGQGKRADHFSIGSRIAVRRRTGSTSVLGTSVECEARFESKAAQPALIHWHAYSGDYKFAYTPESSGIQSEFSGPTGKTSGTLSMPFAERSKLPVGFLMSSLIITRTDPKADEPDPNVAKPLSELANLVSREGFTETVVSAPIRSKPRRTYDLTRDNPDPEGEHVPMVLSQLQSNDSDNWATLQQKLVEFGKASGLLTKLNVKRKGSKPSDPFQIEVAVSQFPFNLLDVGYGISQVLPILVDTLRAPRDARLLLQQPEVHLHPRAQAELGSFFGVEAKNSDKTFIIETHSDYMIDRILMDIRDNKSIDHEDFVILYFERSKGKVAVHPIWATKNGELDRVPENYRDFFLREQRRNLGS